MFKSPHSKETWHLYSQECVSPNICINSCALETFWPLFWTQIWCIRTGTNALYVHLIRNKIFIKRHGLMYIVCKNICMDYFMAFGHVTTIQCLPKKPNNKSNAKKNWQKEKCRTNTDNAHCTQAQNANNIFITLHDLLCIASKINKLCCLTQRIPKTIPYHLHLHRVNKRFCLVVRIVAVVVWLRYNLVCRLSFLLYNCILCSRVEIRESNAHRTIWIHDRRESIHSKHNNHINFTSAFL